MDAIRRILTEATWRDTIVAFVDILIVYYAIYRVLLLIKGTRAAQMVIGLVLIGAGFFAAEQFELATVSWLLDNFINYFIIIIIVVFQHDIRRGLVRIGQNLFNFGRTYEETHVFEEVIHAAEHLAQARIGALIVFEREADVSDLVNTGQIIDARVSRDVLVSLFVPSRENTLHDGAVIIKALRIQQAGAVLPLSSNPRLDKELGTRHRAAIGVTEETDAVAIVVSEERGAISLCFGGNIARDMDSATLRKALVGLFYKDKRKQQDVADEARAAAAAAEAIAALSPSPDATPPEASTPPVPASGVARHPRAETRRVVRAPTAPVTVAMLDTPSGPPPGPPVEGAVTDEQVPTPPAGAPEAEMKGFVRRAFTENAALKAVAFILAVTLFILVRGDKEAERNIAVSVAYVKPQGQTLLGDVPSSLEVRVRGAWTRIKRFDASDVDPILIDLTRASEGELPIATDLIHLPPGLRVASIKPNRINVAYVHERELRIVPEWTGAAADGFRLENRGDDPDHPLTTPSRIKVHGPKVVIDGLANVKTLPIPLDDRRAGFRTRVALVPLPEGVVVVPETKEVDVDVPITEELAKRIVASVPVQIRLPAGASWGKLGPPTSEPASVDIVLSGSRVALAKIVEREVKAVVEIHKEDLAVVNPRNARVLVEGARPGVQSEVNPSEVLLVPAAAPTNR